MIKFKTVYIVHGLILFLFIVSLIYEANKYIDYLDVTGNGISIYFLISTGAFSTALFLVLPVIGVFFKRIIGWIFITQYFYFILFNAFFIDINFEEFDWVFILFYLLPLGLIILMNHKKNYNYYNINKRKLLRFNIIVFVIGLGFSLLLLNTNKHFLLNILHYFSY